MTFDGLFQPIPFGMMLANTQKELTAVKRSMMIDQFELLNLKTLNKKITENMLILSYLLMKFINFGGPYGPLLKNSVKYCVLKLKGEHFTKFYRSVICHLSAAGVDVHHCQSVIFFPAEPNCNS